MEKYLEVWLLHSWAIQAMWWNDVKDWYALWDITIPDA